ncbi:MAG: 1-(5-phosphoribosyl)-5-[(5-phosphoribosylamino)methylideneamino]imidazole-4-carboxamide isomerase, partial [Planctomycetota bacterium]|nr:1-(5-phosphoribosyl)-5-[(5-phosphoribosylamino)methylideneamino]imidazole-4-carboxamide isomerase [Planctomycetota bacterium]
MYIIPAIDLRDSKCVRLIQGQYDRQINYHDNPVEQARQFNADGAQWLHIVDLDGAKLGRPVNTETIAAIAALGKLKIEVGGGLRDEASIKQLLDLGVERVIIGTKAVSDFEWFSEMARKFTGKIVLGLDAKGSKVATHGWTQDSSQTILEFAAEAAKLPLAAIIYTDIAKDGMMSGPNFERTKTLVEAVDVPVVASGGVNTVED